MKKFRHKTQGYYAVEQEKPHNCYTDFVVDNARCIPRECLEGSNDREEVVEKVVPQRMREVIEEYNKNYTHLNDKKLIDALEKYAPKTKKFAEEDIKKGIRDIYTDLEKYVILNELRYFLKYQGLLSDDE